MTDSEDQIIELLKAILKEVKKRDMRGHFQANKRSYY